jgi:hypothetical protein
MLADADSDRRQLGHLAPSRVGRLDTVSLAELARA